MAPSYFVLPLLCALLQTVSAEAFRRYSQPNIAAVVGSTVTLTCTIRIAEQVRWNYRAPQSPEPSVVYTGTTINPKLSARYTVFPDRQTGRSRLVIVDVQLSDAGSYSCMMHNATANAFTSQLIIIATDPKCRINPATSHHTGSEFKSISVDCEVSYRGNWAPVINCQPPGRVVVNNVTNRHVRHREVILRKYLAVHKTVTCTTHFTAPSADAERPGTSPVDYASVPKYRHIWTSPVLTDSEETGTSMTSLMPVAAAAAVGLLILIIVIIVVVLVYRKCRVTAAADSQENNETEQMVRYRVREALPQLVTDSSAGDPTTPPVQFQRDEPDFREPLQYDEIGDFAAEVAPSLETAAEGPYEGLDPSQVEERPPVTVPSVYVPLAPVTPVDVEPELRSSRVDVGKRVRSLPTLVRSNIVQ